MGEVLMTDTERGVGVLLADALDRLGIATATAHGAPPGGQAASAEVWLHQLEAESTRGLVVNHCRLRGGGLSRRSLEIAESVLAAAARCESLERVVVISSGQVYGAGPELPTFVPEGHPSVARPGSSAEDFADLEAAARGFAAVRPDVSLTVLRTAEVVGSAPHGLLAAHVLAAGAYVTTKFGYDPQVQFVTPHAVAAGVVHALTEDIPGVYNLAPSDAVPLSVAISLAGRARLPLLRALSVLGGAFGRGDPWSHELTLLLQYGRALDSQRASEAGFPEASSTAAAIAAAIY